MKRLPDGLGSLSSLLAVVIFHQPQECREIDEDRRRGVLDLGEFLFEAHVPRRVAEDGAVLVKRGQARARHVAGDESRGGCRIVGEIAAGGDEGKVAVHAGGAAVGMRTMKDYAAGGETRVGIEAFRAHDGEETIEDEADDINVPGLEVSLVVCLPRGPSAGQVGMNARLGEGGGVDIARAGVTGDGKPCCALKAFNAAASRDSLNSGPGGKYWTSSPCQYGLGSVCPPTSTWQPVAASRANNPRLATVFRG